MKGAREYVDLIRGEWEQYGKLLMVTSHHARGRTLNIWVLPSEEKHEGKYGTPFPPPEDSIKVYGIVEGQPGWTEVYGWLHRGPWEEDFKDLMEARKEERDKQLALREEVKKLTEEARISNEKKILSNY